MELVRLASVQVWLAEFRDKSGDWRGDEEGKQMEIMLPKDKEIRIWVE